MSIKIYDQVKMVSVDSIKNHPMNDKIHSKNKIKKLSEIIKEFGFDQPITVDEETKEITKGNGRFQAAKTLNLSEIPVIYKKYSSKKQQLADLKSDNEIAIFELHFDKNKQLEILKGLDEKFKPLAMPDFAKMLDTIKGSSHINAGQLEKAIKKQDEIPALKQEFTFTENSNFEEKSPKITENEVKPEEKIHYKTIMIRVESVIHQETQKKVGHFLQENNIPHKVL